MKYLLPIAGWKRAAEDSVGLLLYLLPLFTTFLALIHPTLLLIPAILYWALGVIWLPDTKTN